MIQLSYDPAYDPYHTAFRILRLSVYSEGTPIQIQKLRILDFYLNFPRFLILFSTSSQYALPKGGLGMLRKIDFEKYAVPYSELPDSRIVLRQMEIIQSSAIQTLCTKGFFKLDAFKRGSIELDKQKIQEKLLFAINERNEQQSDLMDFLIKFLAKIELNGPQGLKARTHLLEHKYDSI